MHLNLSDAVEDLAPIAQPACFHSRIAWLMYLKCVAAAQNRRQNQKAIVIWADGQPRFNDRLNYCAECTQAKSMEMLALGRCDPYHLRNQPDPTDTSYAPAVRSGGEVINMAQDDTDTGMVSNPAASDAGHPLRASTRCTIPRVSGRRFFMGGLSRLTLVDRSATTVDPRRFSTQKLAVLLH